MSFVILDKWLHGWLFCQYVCCIAYVSPIELYNKKTKFNMKI